MKAIARGRGLRLIEHWRAAFQGAQLLQAGALHPQAAAVLFGGHSGRCQLCAWQCAVQAILLDRCAGAQLTLATKTLLLCDGTVKGAAAVDVTCSSQEALAEHSLRVGVMLSCTAAGCLEAVQAENSPRWQGS